MDENKEGLVLMQPTESKSRTLRDMILDASKQGKTICVIGAGNSGVSTAEILAMHKIMEDSVLIVDMNTLNTEDQTRLDSAQTKQTPTLPINILSQKSLELTAMNYDTPFLNEHKGEWYEGHKKSKKKKSWR